MHCLVVVLVLGFVWYSSGNADLIVKLKTGSLRGSILNSRNGRDILAFRGIPYTEPPTLSRRFKPPVAKRHWRGILNATEDAPACSQDNETVATSEDCLFLNVYTPQRGDLLPVMVYIHGGAFSIGSGRSDRFGPQYLLDNDIVLVTFNYRLGIFGFIFTDTADAPGNVGFKDQVLAMRWVQNNIRQFGGDPNLVTVFGQSAGGIAINAHLVSPMSRDLFHRAIMMSGSATQLMPPLNKLNTRIIGDAVGCTFEVGFVHCLRSVTAGKLIEASKRLNEFGPDPVRKWHVVVEKDFGQERFLTEDPDSLMVNGKFPRMPIMAGYLSGEYAQLAYYILMRPKLLEQFNDDRYRTNSITLLYPRYTDRSKNITDKLREVYVNGQEFSKDNFDRMCILFGDAIVRFRMKKFMERVKHFQDIYIYSNSYLGRFSAFYYPDSKPYIAAHSDDLQYLFYNRYFDAPLFSKDDKENFMVEKMTRIFTTFAEKGVPFGTESSKWFASNATFEHVYDLSGNQSQKDFESYIDVWNELFPGP